MRGQTSVRSNVLRRRKYTASLVRDSYFVVKHLERFITRVIRQYVQERSKVVDVGCGEQPMRYDIESRGASYIGIDIAQNYQNTVDVIATATEAPLVDGCFDVVLCIEVLEHVSDSLSAFQELSRLLKPGGYLIVTTPFAYPLHEEPYDFVRLTPFQIRRCAEMSALSIVEIEQAGNELEVIATAWDTMWRRMLGDDLSMPAKVWIGMMRVSMNALISICSRVANKHLPGKYYLNTLVVFKRMS